MAEQNFRLRILSHLIAAAAGSALTFLFVQKEIAQKPTDAKQAIQEQAPVVQVPKIPVIPAPVPPLDRAGLIAAAASAADAVARGSALPQSNTALVGRSFILRMPFGCGGEMADGEQKADWAGWTFNPNSRALRLMARSSGLTDADWIKQVAGSMEFDAVEGFWLRRPWTRGERCNAKDPALSDTILDPAAQHLAIAQFYSPQGSRTLRRGDRPYSATVKLEEGEGPSPLGYQLQLEGKLSGFPDAQPVHCSQDNPSVAPRCVIAVEFERVAFVAPGKDEPIVEWR